MNAFEDLILGWMCSFDEFRDFKQSNIKNLLSSGSFKEFVDNVFGLKCSLSFMSDDEKLYNTIKTNCQEFEVEKFEDIYNKENAVYTCIIVLLHALLKCLNNKYRDQLCEKMDDKQQVLLVTLLETTRTSLFTKQNIFEALLVLGDTKFSSHNISETFSNITSIKSKSMCLSYLQEFLVPPKSQFLICQEKEKLIAKLIEDIKNEFEENDRLAENVKLLQDVNLKLSSKLEDKKKIITFLKDEIEELSKPKDFPDIKVDSSLAIKKLNQDILYLEINNNELKQQLVELENQYKGLSAKFEKKTYSYENLLLTRDRIESENMSLQNTINVLKITLQKKDTEITSLKDELCNKSISNSHMELSCQGTNVASSNTLFDELCYLKLEKVTHDKEQYRQKYKSIKKDLLNTEKRVRGLEEQISTLKQLLQDSEMIKDKIINKFTEMKKELLECQKKNNKRDDLIEESNKLKFTYEDYIIATIEEKLPEYEVKINNEKIPLDVESNKKSFEITRQDLTRKLEEMKKKLYDVQKKLDSENLDLELQKKKAEEQAAIISILTFEDGLINDTIALNNYLTKVKLDNTQHELSEKFKTLNNKLSEVQKLLSKLQTVLDNQNKCSNYELELINTLISEKDILVDETIELKEYLAQNEKKLYFEKKYKEIMFELHKLKFQMNNLCQESIEKMFKINRKFYKAQEKFSFSQSNIKKQVELKNDSLVDIYQQINDLKITQNKLELLITKKRTEFETHFETYSIIFVNNKFTLDHHENSLMKVFIFANTFMEKNGNQVIQVKNSDDYFIVERLQKLFEALKMFSINKNTQDNGRVITDKNTMYESNKAYVELLTTSKKQLETIKNLENELARLKSECFHKMSKVQQKTQEYVTSEYKKKFKQKQQLMKQFYIDLEAKMHQDYEAKLMKYKEKISMDEIHIKELNKQLWNISDKYLKLQQHSRQESIISLPHENFTTYSQTLSTANNFPKYNSFTLFKSNSTGQIRSLIEENDRSYQDHSKQNVPSGIGNIFPKKEVEEGEIFTHSCLKDLKQSRLNLNTTGGKQHNKRMSASLAHNSRFPLHLRSCDYVETNVLPNISLAANEDINTLVDYNADCERENLIPKDCNKKNRKISYKRPGPPTPCKNGGRESFLEKLKESKDTNTNKTGTSSIPFKLLSLLKSKK